MSSTLFRRQKPTNKTGNRHRRGSGGTTNGSAPVLPRNGASAETEVKVAGDVEGRAAAPEQPAPNASGTEMHSQQQASSAILAGTTAKKRKRAGLMPIIGLALLLTVLPAIAAYLLASAQDEVFVAEVDVVHELTNAQFGDVDRVMANAKIAAERRQLSEEVAERYDLEVADFVNRRSIDVVVPDTGATSTVLRFKVEDTNPRAARREVDRLANGYLDDQVTEDPDALLRVDLENTIADLQSRRISAQDGLAAAQTAKDNATFDGLTAAEYTERVAELDRNRVAAGSRYEEILSDIDTQSRLLTQLEPDGLQVSAQMLGEPFVSDEPVSPKPLRSLALGLAVGLLLAGTWLFAALQFRAR